MCIMGLFRERLYRGSVPGEAVSWVCSRRGCIVGLFPERALYRGSRTAGAVYRVFGTAGTVHQWVWYRETRVLAIFRISLGRELAVLITNR